MHAYTATESRTDELRFRRYQRRFMKWLIANHPEAWTPMRFVSLDEFKESAHRSVLMPDYAPIYVMGSGTLTANRSMKGPGYYRVDRNKTEGLFTQSCAGGIPYHHRNQYVQQFERILDEGTEREKLYKAKMKAEREKKFWLSYTKNEFINSFTTDPSSAAFTQAMVSAGEIARRMR